MNLEQLVPPLEMCKQIPEGAFADSALVWITDGCGENPIAEPRRYAPYDRIECPAPTLAEILEELAHLELWSGIDLAVNEKGKVCGSVHAARRHVGFCGCSAATAALKLWMEVNK